MSYDKDILLQSAVDLLRFPSVKEPAAGPGKPFGQPISQALDYMLDLGQELGFKTENYSGYAGHIEFGEGEEILGVLCHLDVVPPGQGWSVEPFGGVIKDGRLYGRGTIDNKGPAIAVLYAMASLKDSGWKPQCRVRLILGTDEESQWGCMDHYLKVAQKPDFGFAPDAEFPVINAEKGIIMLELKGPAPQPPLLSIKGGDRPNMVPDVCHVALTGEIEKNRILNAATEIGARCQVETTQDGCVLKFSGVSAHGSTPEHGDNAISYGLAVLAKLGFVQGLPGFLHEAMGFACDGRGLGIELRDSVSGSLTVNLGVMDSSDDGIRAMLDIRYPVTYTQEHVLSLLKSRLPKDVSLRGLAEIKPLHVDSKSELVEILQRVYEKHTGEEAKLISIGGGTYARALDNAVAFGPVFPGQPELAHQRDEYIAIDHLYKLVEIYKDAISFLSEKGGKG